MLSINVQYAARIHHSYSKEERMLDIPIPNPFCEPDEILSDYFAYHATQTLKANEQQQHTLTSVHMNIYNIQTWIPVESFPKKLKLFSNTNDDGQREVELVLFSKETFFICRCVWQIYSVYCANISTKCCLYTAGDNVSPFFIIIY